MKKKNTKLNFEGGFFAIPHNVLNSIAYSKLSAYAVKLLIDIGSEYRGTNNGDLNATFNSLKKKNWHSKGTLNNAIKELKEFGFIEVSRQGGRNKCSLYALTFRPVNICKGKLDIKHTDKPSNLWKNFEPIKSITADDLQKEKIKQLNRDTQKLTKDWSEIQKRYDEINITAH
jgi:hypothetical protein